MKDSNFHPKVFYRKFDSLLARIGKGAGTTEVLSLVLDELVESFGSDLRIKSGCFYRLRKGSFELVKGPVGDSGGGWPRSVPREDETVSLLARHKSYLFCGEEVSPWRGDSVAVMVGEADQYMMVFKLMEGWERETLEFSLNTIRSVLNYGRSTRRLAADIEEASRIQRSLLPEHDPVFEAYDIAGRSEAAELVGGDLFDYQLLGGKVLGLAIGDASGHGLPAALLARDVLTGLRMGVEKEMKISGVIGKLNRVINRSSLSTRFVSLVYGELERNGTIVYINAGHPAPILVKESSEQELGTGGTILGPIADTVFKRGFAFMEAGDVLLLFTDGITEREGPDGDFFGVERLKEFVRREKLQPAASIIDKLYAELFAFGAGENWADDATVVVVKRVA